MKNQLFKTVFIFSFCFIISSFIQVNAQETGLSLSPSLSEIIVKPGKSILLGFSLENIADPALVSLKVSSFQPSHAGETITTQSDLKGPIDFSIDTVRVSDYKDFIMKTHEKRNINLLITIPEETKEGDYYYSLIAQTDPPPNPEGYASARARVAIASNILMTVAKKKPIDQRAKIVLFESRGSFSLNIIGKKIRVINADRGLEAILTVQNDSLYRIKPSGTIELTPKFGKKQFFTLQPQNILAQSQRTLKADSQVQKTDSSLYLKPISFGLYTVKASLIMPGSSERLSSRFDVLAISFSLVNGTIFIIGVICIIFILKKSKVDPHFEHE